MQHAQERRRGTHNDPVHIRTIGQGKGHLRKKTQKGMDKGTLGGIRKDETQNKHTHATRIAIRQTRTETKRD
jgi:hypothetical protein